MERFFTRRAGPLATAWQERHVEEDFLARFAGFRR